MNILPSSLLSQYIAAIQLDGKPVNATFVDMETGRVQYWDSGNQVEATGKIHVLLESKDAKVSLDPILSNELDKLLEQAKQHMASMSPEDQRKAYEEQKQSFLRAIATAPYKPEGLGCKALDCETCTNCGEV